MADTNLTRGLPAPKTFAPSREDVLSTLAFFFGDPAVPEKLRDYSEHHAMTYHFPDAYYGQNTYANAPPLARTLAPHTRDSASDEDDCTPTSNCGVTDDMLPSVYSGWATPLKMN